MEIVFAVSILVLIPAPPVEAQCMENVADAAKGGLYILGSIDEHLLTHVFNNDRTGRTLHTDTRGLFFLPAPIGTKGQVTELCAFGYPRLEDESKLTDGMGNLDVDPKIRLFLYIILYRQAQTLFTMVYNPTVVYHGFDPGCISQDDGLNWVVEEGDFLGAFIPDHCTTSSNLTSQADVDTVDTFNEEELIKFEFCPAQIDLNVTGDICSYALYLNFTDGTPLDELKSVDFEDFVNVSVRLNIQVKVEERSFGARSSVVIGIISAVLFLLIITTAVVICTLLLRRKHQQHMTEYDGTTEYNKELRNELNKAAPHQGYVVTRSEHDYDEPYFEPASEYDTLLGQLKELGVTSIQENSLIIHEVLGSGSFGVVYKGVWLHSKLSSDQVVKEEVAVKTMESGAIEVDRVKFLQEAAITGQFDHPNIIKLIGVTWNSENKKPMLVVELMGGDLREHLINLNSLCCMKEVPPELSPTLLSFTRQVAFGMLYLSEKLFVHRDLAARNILISPDKTICKIADFGLSRDLQEQSHYIAHGGKIPVKWTAPEALHYRKYSTASDVWSYGCVLYEIWSLGHKPFQELINTKVMRLLSTGYRLPPPPGCPRAIYEVMIKSWNPEEAARPTFCEVVVSLQQPDFQILKWPSADEARYSKAARTLGSPIEKGHGLHPELQRSYLRKGSADSSGNPLMEMCNAAVITKEETEDSSKLQTPNTVLYDILTESDTCEGAGSCKNPSRIPGAECVYDEGYDVLSKSDEGSIDM